MAVPQGPGWCGGLGLAGPSLHREKNKGCLAPHEAAECMPLEEYDVALGKLGVLSKTNTTGPDMQRIWGD